MDLERYKNVKVLKFSNHRRLLEKVLRGYGSLPEADRDNFSTKGITSLVQVSQMV